MVSDPAGHSHTGSIPQIEDMNNLAQRIILHLDMDSFYASVEVGEHPDLRGKPVVIGADPRNGKGRGVVVTCSYEARAFGIHSAMPISQAFILCPHAVFLPPDFRRYVQVSEAIMTVLRSYGFRFQQVSVDEAFLDVSPLGSFPEARRLSVEIKKFILSELGLTCSIGVGPGKVVAKIASDFHKPDGLTVIEPADVAGFLAPLQVRKIPGVGKKSESELFELGIRTIGDLAAYDTRALIARFGHGALFLQEIARGIDRSEVEERNGVNSVSRETTFGTDTSDPQVIFMTMATLAGEVHRSLAAENLRFRTLTIKVRYQGFITKTKARTLSHFTNEERIIRTCAHSLLQEVIDGRKVRLLGLRLSSFDRKDPGQVTLPAM
jgi:DNA polymerase IV (DinB-like DNA polymerase)